MEILEWDYIALIKKKYNWIIAYLNEAILYSAIEKNIFLWFKI